MKQRTERGRGRGRGHKERGLSGASPHVADMCVSVPCLTHYHPGMAQGTRHMDFPPMLTEGSALALCQRYALDNLLIFEREGFFRHVKKIPRF